MIILSIIMGVLLVVCGVSCFMNPLETLLSTGYFIGIVFLVRGLAGIIRNFRYKIYGLDFALNIVNAIVGVICVVRPGSTLAIDAMIIWLVSFWLIIQGCIRVALGCKAKKLNVDYPWIFEILLGILSVVLGIFSLANPYVAAVSVGMMIGIYFIESGIQTIVMSIFAGKVKHDVNKVLDQVER